jgi:putative phosphoesterase
MKKIGLLSDTHGWLDEGVAKHFQHCDELWHAGDFGGIAVAEDLERFAGADGKMVRGVYGNIDGSDVRSVYPEYLSWKCEGVSVLMTHIGGYPKKYAPGVRQRLLHDKPKLFICGHSHILKIIYDGDLHCLHMNPGAAGKQGWHKVRTIIRFTIDGADIRDCEVIELGRR